MFLATVLQAGEFTELQINRSFPQSPNSSSLCLSVKFRQEIISLVSRNDEADKVTSPKTTGWNVPPMLIKIQPENNNHAAVVVPIKGNPDGKWVEIRMKLPIRPTASFKIFFQQSGSLIDRTMSGPSSVASSFRVSLEKIFFHSGQSC